MAAWHRHPGTEDELHVGKLPAIVGGTLVVLLYMSAVVLLMFVANRIYKGWERTRYGTVVEEHQEQHGLELDCVSHPIHEKRELRPTRETHPGSTRNSDSYDTV